MKKALIIILFGIMTTYYLLKKHFEELWQL